MKFMTALDLKGKRVLIREDLNVPIKSGSVTSDARLTAVVPTIRAALAAGAGIMLMSHLGRPTEGEYSDDYSLAPVAQRLGELLDVELPVIRDWQSATVSSGELVLLENVRFNTGETSNDSELAKQYASLCDIFVMDAFGTAHRAQASTHGVAKYAPVACAGPLLATELAALATALSAPARPMLAIVGGSKVSTKLEILEQLADQCDSLIVGGGIANTFLAAAGYPVGKSLCEADLIDTARTLMDRTLIPLPIDVVVAKTFSDQAQAVVKLATEVAEDDLILDIGPQSVAVIVEQLTSAGTILWNGPVGVFEFSAFAGGTEAVANAIAGSKGFSLAGGGDTLAAIDKFGIAEQVSYISTGGGAFLEFVEGKTLPAVDMLEQRSQ